ncbi:Bax inhibitor-1/YccA family protein [Gordonia polyisoprenivorans]|uniref:Bax inhibitor-1/YccA family protein n=1 Tax=Gordonia polyisoprenivorans TaxID=84595 RepID=UPI001B8D6B88|nr:Bax inhibitor-1/YccA family protein [Gordonia polyisoprenivorans]QUD81385.1 Bax inhibitor-1/YccA family protein [Gordonia polyisoprenivorans]
MRDSSNPVMRGVVRDNQTAGGYAGFGTGAAGAGQAAMYNQYGQQVPPYTQQPTTTTRQLTIDDVVTKTAITLGVLTISAIAAYFLVSANEALAMPLFGISAIVGLVLVLIASFGRKQDNPAIVLGYAVFEGLFVGSISYVFANWMVSGTSAGALIGQAVLGTFGVFFGMLLVYKVGAIRVTPRFTRMLFAGLIGVIVLMVGNLIMSLFTGGAGILRDGGPIAIIFSLICIALAAFSFLVDFDAADRLIRAGAPDRAAWGVALGLTVTLVWLYVEILRLLSYFQSD